MVSVRLPRRGTRHRIVLHNRASTASSTESDTESVLSQTRVQITSSLRPALESIKSVVRPRMLSSLQARNIHTQNSHFRSLEGKFINQRGQSLSYCSLFPPAEVPLRGVILFLHALGDHYRRYYHLFDKLCAHNFGVIAYDMVSHGTSDCCTHNLRAHARKFDYFVQDTNEFVALAKSTIFPRMLQSDPTNDNTETNTLQSPPLIIMGTSFGTLVALHTVLSLQHQFHAVILSAPLVSIKWTPVLRLQAKMSRSLSMLMPKARIVPTSQWSDQVCRDPGTIEDYINDPLTTIGDMTTRMGEQTLKAIMALHNDPRFLQSESLICSVPILFLMGSNDFIANIPLAKQFYQRMKNEDKEFRMFDGAYHALFDDPEQDDIIHHVLHWLCQRFAFAAPASIFSTPQTKEGGKTSNGTCSTPKDLSPMEVRQLYDYCDHLLL